MKPHSEVRPSDVTIVVRGVPDCFVEATRQDAQPTHIDLERARRQHRSYVAALTAAGAQVTELPPDEGFPDCCFVEDQAVVLGTRALITRSGLASRRGEAEAVKALLGARLELTRMSAPATLDGGDVLVLRDRVLVGVGGRTNDAGLACLRAVANASGLAVEAVPVPSPYLHLKSACSALTPDVVLAVEGVVDAEIFPADVKVIWIPESEAYAANSVAVGETALIAAGYEQTRKLVEGAGFGVVPLEMSEFRGVMER